MDSVSHTLPWLLECRRDQGWQLAEIPQAFIWPGWNNDLELDLLFGGGPRGKISFVFGSQNDEDAGIDRAP